MGELSLESILEQTYPGLFQKGLDRAEVLSQGISPEIYQKFFIECLNNPAKVQVCVINQVALDGLYKKNGVLPADQAKINSMFSASIMNSVEIREKCVSIRPYMADVFDCWSNSQMKHFLLTSAGIAIGHANIKRFAGEFSNLSIWIN
jgi:hypothetical protein